VSRFLVRFAVKISLLPGYETDGESIL